MVLYVGKIRKVWLRMITRLVPVIKIWINKLCYKIFCLVPLIKCDKLSNVKIALTNHFSFSFLIIIFKHYFLIQVKNKCQHPISKRIQNYSTYKYKIWIRFTPKTTTIQACHYIQENLCTTSMKMSAVFILINKMTRGLHNLSSLLTWVFPANLVLCPLYPNWSDKVSSLA